MVNKIIPEDIKNMVNYKWQAAHLYRKAALRAAVLVWGIKQ